MDTDIVQERIDMGFDLRAFHCPGCLGAMYWPEEEPFDDEDCGCGQMSYLQLRMTVFSRLDGRIYEMPLSEPWPKEPTHD